MAEEFPPDFVQHLDAIPFGDLPLVVSAYHGVAVACSLKQLAPNVDIAEAQAQAKQLGLFQTIQTTDGTYSRLTQRGQNILFAMLWNLTQTASEMAKAALGEAAADPKVQ